MRMQTDWAALIRNWFLGASAGGLAEDATDTELALAALLSQMVHADMRRHDAARPAALRLLASHFGLDPGEAEQLLERGEQAASDAVSLFEHTRTLDVHLSEEEKFAVIEALWETAYADGQLDSHEDDLAHRLAALLHVRHSDLIRIREGVHDRWMSKHGHPEEEENPSSE